MDPGGGPADVQVHPLQRLHGDLQMRPDSPCIAVCTTLYDEKCKGCGRTYLEVAHWNEMALPDREVVWQRIDKEATAWRYNRYKDRVK